MRRAILSLAVAAALSAPPTASADAFRTGQRASDAEAVGLHRQTAQRVVAGYTNCPQIRFVLGAKAAAAIDRAYPNQDWPAQIGGMASDDDPKWDHPAYGRCTVWLRPGLKPEDRRRIIIHEIMHTAGWEHGELMDEECAKAQVQVSKKPANALNRRAGSGSLRGMKKIKSTQPKVRSRIGREAHQQTGAGKHGGSSRQQRRRDRQNMKRALRAGSED